MEDESKLELQGYFEGHHFDMENKMVHIRFKRCEGQTKKGKPCKPRDEINKWLMDKNARIHVFNKKANLQSFNEAETILEEERYFNDVPLDPLLQTYYHMEIVLGTFSMTDYWYWSSTVKKTFSEPESP